MGVRTIVGVRDGIGEDGTPAVCMMDSVTGIAFGLVFDTYNECEAFQKFWSGDMHPLSLREYNAASPEWAAHRDRWVEEGRPFYDAEADEVVDAAA